MSRRSEKKTINRLKMMINKSELKAAMQGKALPSLCRNTSYRKL
jgi:hypothetical protein